jgi:hypothetical protein
MVQASSVCVCQRLTTEPTYIVRGEDDDCILVLIGALELVDNKANLVVKGGHHGIAQEHIATEFGKPLKVGVWHLDGTPQYE